LEGNGVGFVTATAPPRTVRKPAGQISLFVALASAGFRRYATYRQATVASAFTNSVFGFLKTFVLLGVAAAAGSAVAGTAAGYDGPQLATFVWAGQGLIGVVGFWGWTDLADRIRTGEVVTDLLRPVHPVLSYLFTDLGRAGYGVLTRFLPPIVVGALAFDLYAPRRPSTYALFAVSVTLATVISFGCRYLVNATAFWLLDARGILLGWAVASTVLSGLVFPIPFLPPGWAAAVWIATPFPSLFQTPLDVLVEREPPAGLSELMGIQVGWVLLVLWLCRLVQRRAERKLVIQGG
jgi:ABC-2 type transport system permease protein